MTSRVRGAIGLAGVAVTARLARSPRVGPGEAAIFRWVNNRSDEVTVPAYCVMQLGNVVVAPVAAAAAVALGRRSLGRRLLVAGFATWWLSKLTKVVVGRPRPQALLSGVHVRGRAQTGLGYLSGHAGVAFALAAAARPELPRRARLAVGIAAPAVALTRVYVGAHLPLDIVGGAALGLAVESVVEEVVDGWPGAWCRGQAASAAAR